MNKTNNFKKTKIGSSILRITNLGLFLTLLCLAKWKFGFNIDGIEVVTGLFMLSALFFTIIECILLLISFITMCLVIYGFYSALTAYFCIFIGDILLVKLIFSKIKFNLFIFSLLALFLGGLWLSLWFFISDTIFYGIAFSTATLPSGLIINSVEGITNFIFLIIITDPLIFIYKQTGFLYKNKYVHNYKSIFSNK